jgi:hypothetical protein
LCPLPVLPATPALWLVLVRWLMLLRRLMLIRCVGQRMRVWTV